MLLGGTLAFTVSLVAPVIVFIAVAGGWYPAIIIECLVCLVNPYFCWGFMLDKLLFRGRYLQLANPPAYFNTADPFSMNGILPEIIGLSLSIIMHPLLIMRAIKKGSGIAAKTGNDGTFQQISSKRDKFPGASAQDMDAEF